MIPLHPRTVALIVAAGESQRMGGGLPKQYRPLAGKTVLRRSAEALLNHPQIDAVCVVIHPDHRALYEQTMADMPLLPPAIGGATRQESVKNGIEHLFSKHNPKHLLVHDAARCFIDAETISRVISALAHYPAVIPSIPLADTPKTVENSRVEVTLPRQKIHLAQTPQGFDATMLRELHLNAHSESSTDDASLAEEAGLHVHCVAGDARNFKITTDEDWKRAEMLTQPHYSYRTGMGFDVHRLIPKTDDRPLRICGVTIPHSHALEGHSDADVGLHALTDALLGALAMGDIGTHFPPSDNRWKDADSADFVRYCTEALTRHGATLEHADITLICEAPKIGPHRSAMQTQVANLLGVDSSRINIKATTSEGLGFTGRREGIAAQAIATLKIQESPAS